MRPLRRLLISITVITIIVFLTVFILPITVGDKLEDILSTLVITASLIAVIQLIISIYQFETSRFEDKIKKEQERKSLLHALALEIAMNENVCFEINNTKNKNNGEHTIPESIFHIKLLENCLSQGFIVVESGLNINFWDLFRYCSVSNSLLLQAKQILHYEHISNPRDLMLISGRKKKINQLLDEVYKYNQEIRTLLNHLKQEIENLSQRKT